jgi:hypothetical protein
MYVITGISSGDRSLKVNNPDINTLAAALLERMYYCKVGEKFVEPPQIKYSDIKTTLSGFRNRLLREIGIATRISPEQFAEMYSGRKRTIYEKAVDEYYGVGVRREHSISAAFVKCEKVPSNKAPRCIQPRKPVYNVGVGIHIKHLEHRLYGAISRVFRDDVVVVKGFNVCQVATIIVDKWQSFSNPVGLGLDATKFDMHVCDGMLQWEHSIYLAIHGNDRTLSKYLGWQRDNKGVGHCEDGKLTYSVQGRRFSGDMNTALGNCIIMCALVWTYARLRGVRIKLANNGDDCMVFMERDDLHQFANGLEKWFLGMGFRMTIEKPVFNVNKIEFCQMKPIYTNRGWTMVRNIPKAREKDSISIIPLTSEKVARKWLFAVGECGMALCGGVPIMQSMYKAYMRAGLKSRIATSVAMESGALMMSRGLESKEFEISDEARAQVFSAWGYTPDEQTALEQEYDHLDIDVTSVAWVTDELELLFHQPY